MIFRALRCARVCYVLLTKARTMFPGSVFPVRICISVVKRGTCRKNEVIILRSQWADVVTERCKCDWTVLASSSSFLHWSHQTGVAPNQPRGTAAPLNLLFSFCRFTSAAKHAQAVTCSPVPVLRLSCLVTVSLTPLSPLSLPQLHPHIVSCNCHCQPLVPTIFLVAQLI